ncbi:MAG: Lrp/AsnC family transcriptional regulator [Syntrophus sp. (in: bacteria)]|nr:Lrp/AsnC family transcriptional regulator [Syntrophus sp. (in: bacteria)]
MIKLLEDMPSQFPITERPYREMAETMGISEEELIDALKDLKTSGIVRRVAAVLSHRNTGYVYNAMVVWKVDEDDRERAGAVMGSFHEVSHCYERDTGSYWDYTLYTMVHGKTHEECMKSIEDIAQRTGLWEYRIFFSKREFKKTSFSMNHV